MNIEKTLGWTTVEQAKRLMENRTDPLSADMCYEKSEKSPADRAEYEIVPHRSIAIEQNLFSYRNGYTLPCWSMGALIKLVRPWVEDNGEYAGLYHFKMGFDSVGHFRQDGRSLPCAVVVRDGDIMAALVDYICDAREKALNVFFIPAD